MTDPKFPGERDEQQEQEKWYERTWYQAVLFTAGFILWGLTLWMLLNLYFDPQTSAQKQSLVETMVVFMGGAAFLFGFSFIARYLQVPYSGVIAVTFLVVVAVLWVLVQPETTNQRISFFQTVGGIVGGSALLFGLYFTAQALQVNREGQITERFTRAIDQLGATDEATGKPRLEIRLGGIYALERIARDSPKRDYSTVMEVLTAYVRENTTQAPGPSEGSSEAASPSNEATAEAERVGEQRRTNGDQGGTERRRFKFYTVAAAAELLGVSQEAVRMRIRRGTLRSEREGGHVYVMLNAEQTEEAEQDAPPEPSRPTADIQAILDVLGRAQTRAPEAYRTRLDLHEAGLGGAYLYRANLQGAIMPNGQKYEDWLKRQRR
jgi:excisionase family DNA binding protein